MEKNNMGVILDTRKKSVVTGLENLNHLITIENFPAYIGNTVSPRIEDIHNDLIFDICKDSGIIQLRNTLDPNIVYPRYHSEAIGNVWAQHHVQLSKLIIDIIHKNPNLKNVIEVGGSNAGLSSLVLADSNTIHSWLIVDPNCSEGSTTIDSRIKFINEFFDPKIIKTNPDLIIHSHTLEHMYDPNDFLNSISKSIPAEGYQIFSVPNFYSYLKNKFINTLNFEHTLFLTEDIIDYLLEKNNLEILDKVYYLDHSIFYVTKKTKRQLNPILPNKYEEYKEMYLNCIDYYKNLVVELNNKMQDFDNEIYLFGGHVFSQFLINLGLNTKKIKCILDNSILKNNTRLYGCDLNIKLPGEAGISNGAAIILKVGAYKNEIVDTIKSINPNVLFWE